MKKTVRIGTASAYDGRRYSIFCKIEVNEDGDLSISGVEGPTHDGNAIGGCGQIDGDLRQNLAHITPAPGWNRATIRKFLDIWDRWHLNDMRPNCEHQVGPEWEYHNIEVTKYAANWDLTKELRRVAAMDALEQEGLKYDLDHSASLAHVAEYSTAAEILWGFSTLGLQNFTHNPLPAERLAEVRQASIAFSSYLDQHPNAIEAKTETKGNGWVHPNEHPEGILGKACPVCGYKYGHAWKKEEVPADVIAWLEALPDTDITPAWV